VRQDAEALAKPRQEPQKASDPRQGVRLRLKTAKPRHYRIFDAFTLGKERKKRRVFNIQEHFFVTMQRRNCQNSTVPLSILKLSMCFEGNFSYFHPKN
jgi:hypothetical protein